MTTLEKLRKAERWRVKTGSIGSNETCGWNGAFVVPLDGGLYHVLISDHGGWRHLSIKNAQNREIPSWQTMCRVKELFWGDEEWVVQYHPARDDYVNDHPGVLHLWQPIEEKLPTPPVVMV